MSIGGGCLRRLSKDYRNDLRLVKSAGSAPSRDTKEKKNDGTYRGAPDFVLLALVLVLVALGLLFVLSSSSYTQGMMGDSLAEFRSQAQWALVGLAGMTAASLVDYRKLRNSRFVWLVIIGTLVLLILVLLLPKRDFIICAPYINGSRRWIQIRSGNSVLFSIQPGEIAKFAIILFMAVRLSNRPKDLPYFSRSIVPCMAMAGVFFVLIMAQPNLSTGGTVMIITVIMLFVAGVKIWHLMGPILALIPIGVGLMFSADYRASRYASFMDPWSMAGDEAYQLVQSLYALANGGLFGTGFGMSRQKFNFLPYASSDFIFSIVAEEVGFIGCIVILGLFVGLIYCGLRVAMNSPDNFGTLMAAGITSHVAVQVLINIAVITGSMPTTGIPLPFFTAGGTSLAIFMTEIGVLLSISRHRKLTNVK